MPRARWVPVLLKAAGADTEQAILEGWRWLIGATKQMTLLAQAVQSEAADHLGPRLESVERATMPGSGLYPSGWRTAWERLKLFSRLAVVEVPLFNYYRASDREIGTFIGTEADGMMHGYFGCNPDMSWAATWTAPAAAEELAPVREDPTSLGPFSLYYRVLHCLHL